MLLAQKNELIWRIDQIFSGPGAKDFTPQLAPGIEINSATGNADP